MWRSCKAASASGPGPDLAPTASTIGEGDVLKVGDKALEVWHTPGHTHGQLSFRMDEFLFCGCGDPRVDRGHGISPKDEKEALGVQEQFGVLQEQVSMLILSTVI